jgi:hypothetical protein
MVTSYGKCTRVLTFEIFFWKKKVVHSVFVGCLNDTLEADKIEVPISYLRYIYIYI